MRTHVINKRAIDLITGTILDRKAASADCLFEFIGSWPLTVAERPAKSRSKATRRLPPRPKKTE